MRPVLRRPLLGMLAVLYRLSAALCPPAFRESYRDEMLDCYRRRLADLAVQGIGPVWRYAWRSQTDILRIAREIRRQDKLPPRKKDRPMQNHWHDFRFALRALTRKPLLSLITILTLALGIGVNSVIFSGVNAILLSRPQAKDPEGLVYLFFHNRRTGTYSDSFSYPNYQDLKEQNSVFSGILLYQMHRAALTIGGGSEIHFGQKVSENYFEVLGVEAARGRLFRPGDGTQSRPVVVISHSLWRDRFGSDPSTVGQTLLMDRQGFTVLGVMPQGFQGTEYGLSMDFWLPVSEATQAVYPNIHSEVRCRDCGNYDPAMARLRTGVSFVAAQAELETISRRLEQDYPQEQRDLEVHLLEALGPPIDPAASRMVRQSGWLAMAFVAMVLLIACANVASLMLTRADTRRREIGIRAALGAGRRRLMRLLLTESFMLAGLGGLFALILAWLTSSFLWTSVMPHMEYKLAIDFSPDGRVFAFTLATALLTGLLFGLAPAWQAARTDLIPSLKDTDGRSKRRPRGLLRSGLVVGQVMLSFVLLTVSGLFMVGLINARALGPGFETENILFVSLDLQREGRTPESGREFLRQIRQGIEALPGVALAEWTQNLPLDDKGWASRVWAEGLHQSREQTIRSEEYAVGPDFFRLMSIPLLQGRFFRVDDRPEGPLAAIVSQSLARRIWQQESPLRRRLRLGTDSSLPWLEVVGVVADLKNRSLWERDSPAVYTSLTQNYFSSLTLAIRSAEGDPVALVPSVRRTVQAVDPQIPLYDVKSIRQHLTRGLWASRTGADLSLLFGVLALVLAAVGLYGVVSHSVSRRTREIGVRLALGAHSRDIVKLVARHSLGLLILGTSLGVLTALLVSQLLEGLVFGVEKLPWLLLVGVASLLAAVTLAASLVPTRRALHIDPTQALRFE